MYIYTLDVRNVRVHIDALGKYDKISNKYLFKKLLTLFLLTIGSCIINTIMLLFISQTQIDEN